MYGLPKRKHAANGGLIEGPGTGTSDSIDKQAPVGSYIMPADSTAAVGHDGLAKLGLSKKSVPVKVSNGEYEMPPEQVHAVGVQALNQIKDATHQPVAQPAQGPQQFFANGGAISNPLEGVGEYWSKDNAEFESGNPGLMARTGRALNPLTGFGSAVGAMHDAAGQGSIRDMGIAAVQSIPVFGAVRAVAPTLKTAAGLAPSLGKTAIVGSGNVAAGVGTDEVQAQSFYQGGPVLDPEELKKKQASFDITNTPSAQLGIRNAQSAAAPAIPTPGNPERAARMQAQFDQPVTKGGAQPMSNQPVAAGFPKRKQDVEPGLVSTFADGVTGSAKAIAGALAYPQLALADGARNLAGNLAGGDTSQLTQYRDGAANLATEGFDQTAGAAKTLREDLASGVRDTLGIRRREPQTDGKTPGASNPYSGEPFDQWAKSQGAMRSTSPATPNTSPVSADAPGEQGNGYTRTGIGQGRQGGEIVGRMGANGVPEFTNEAATPGAVSGAGPAGSVGRVGNGQGGTFSVGEPGDAQLAYDRNERAIAERQKMIEVSRRGQIGEGGGRVTIVRDSSRTPSNAELLNARLEARQTQANLQNQQAQLGLKRDAREDAQLDLDRQRLGIDRQKGEIEAQAAQIGLQASQRLNQIRAQLANPALPADQRAQLEQAYAMLTIDAKDRYMTVVGGENEAGAKQASTVFDRITRQAVGGTATVTSAQAAQSKGDGQGSQPQIGKIYKDPDSGSRAMFKGSDANGNPIWEELN